jgi:SanA protein
MSGDNSTVYYNEPESMRQYALSLGVPDDAIVLDYAGRRTYDTCYRALNIFGIESAVITTQPYHLPRALFLCDRLGIDIQGVEVEQSRYVRARYIF